MVITAIGNNPATLTLPTSVKIVDCATDNSISGGSWVQNKLVTELTVGPTTDIQISPYS